MAGLRKDSYQKGTNKLTADEVLQYGVLEFQDGGTKKRKKEVDATFVIGRSNQRGVDKPKETLLVARCYNLIKKCLILVYSDYSVNLILSLKLKRDILF